MSDIHNWNQWIGTDEAGKGDYFGPLVVAGVYINDECRDDFLEIGITDGKKISNTRVRKLADWMYDRYAEHIIVKKKMPKDYNSLYSNLENKGKNLNNMLAQLHVDVIQSLASQTGTKNALVDKFPKYDILTPLLTIREIKIKLQEKAEKDIAVAAASVIARNTFLTSMESLSKKYQLELPRGAYQVTDAGREFVKMHGKATLHNVAKLHFRTTKDVIT